MLWLKMLKGIIKVLHSDVSPRQVGAGAAMGAIIGLTPFNALHNYVVFLLIFLLPVNIGAAFLSIAFFRIAGFLVDPLADLIGYGLLVQAKPLVPLWTSLYNTPVVPFTRFNNTVLLGSLVIALVLFVPVSIGTQKMILYYRAHWRQKVENMKLVKLLKLTSLFNIYDRVRRGE